MTYAAPVILTAESTRLIYNRVFIVLLSFLDDKKTYLIRKFVLTSLSLPYSSIMTLKYRNNNTGIIQYFIHFSNCDKFVNTGQSIFIFLFVSLVFLFLLSFCLSILRASLHSLYQRFKTFCIPASSHYRSKFEFYLSLYFDHERSLYH